MNSKMAGAGSAILLMLVALAAPRAPLASPQRGGVAAAPTLSLPIGAPEAARFPLALRYSCPRAGMVSLAICTPDGWQVRSLVDQAAALGEHQVIWDGLDDQGHRARGNAYLAVLRVDGRIVGQPFVLSQSCWKAERSAASGSPVAMVR